MAFKLLLRLSALVCVFFSVIFLVGCGGGGGGKAGPSSHPGVVSSSSSIASSQAVSVSSSSASSIAKSTYNVIKIPAPSLSNNIIGDLAQRNIAIYLPKEYFNSDALLPVVYYLPGFGDPTMINMSLPGDLDFAFKTVTPMIVVIVPGIDRFGGSFFVDSTVIGNWSEFVVKDVVNYVDANYRTIPKITGRGLSGHSMGGFGALDIAMRHPDVFGSVFALSPGLVGSKGIEDTQMFDSAAHIKSMIAIIEPLKNLSESAALLAIDSNNQSFDIIFDMAYGMAFAPKNTPPYFEYPYTLVNNNLVRDDAIMAKWEAGFGGVHQEITEFKSNLSALNGIGLDCGINDEYQWIVRGCDYYNNELTAANISLNYTTHNGKHQDQIRARILNVMLPFFAQHLNN